MKCLDKVFCKYGRIFSEVYVHPENPTFRIYEVTSKSDDFKYWEVIKVGYSAGGYTFPNGVVTVEGETYPTTSQWGINGWTISKSFDDALSFIDVKYSDHLKAKAKAKANS